MTQLIYAAILIGIIAGLIATIRGAEVRRLRNALAMATTYGRNARAEADMLRTTLTITESALQRRDDELVLHDQKIRDLETRARNAEASELASDTEVHRLEEDLTSVRSAHREWNEKTAWVQDRAGGPAGFPFLVLGRHRADVIYDLVDHLEATVAVQAEFVAKAKAAGIRFDGDNVFIDGDAASASAMSSERVSVLVNGEVVHTGVLIASGPQSTEDPTKHVIGMYQRSGAIVSVAAIEGDDDGAVLVPASDDGWIEHDGKGMPVPGEAIIEFIDRDGIPHGPHRADIAGSLWFHIDPPFHADAMRYRVVTPATANA